MARKGIDVSSWQDSIDWKKVKADGYDFVIVRAGFGQSASQVDKMFRSHIQGALLAGLQVGAYWFGYAHDAAGGKQEAEVCSSILREFKDRLSFPVFYDWEYDSERYVRSLGYTPTKQMVTGTTIAFMDRLKELGFEAGYYTNPDYFSRLYDYMSLRDYPLWYAYYADRVPDKPCMLQQYSADGRVAGAAGKIDLNYLREFKGAEKPTEPPAAKPVASVEKVYTVQPGDTLSGIAAKYGTTYQKLAEYNGIGNPNFILSGQKIKIPGATEASKPAEHPQEKTYTVKPGDTLSGIAAKYGTSWQKLVELNGLSNPDLIYGGQVLKLP